MKFPTRERAALQRKPISPDWQRYEQLKRAWQDKHPDATPREHELAMQRIARELGV